MKTHFVYEEKRLAVTRYDVLILDRDLPGVHGDEIWRRLAHGRCETRVLMLTASGTIEDRVDGLGLGAGCGPSSATRP